MGLIALARGIAKLFGLVLTAVILLGPATGYFFNLYPESDKNLGAGVLFCYGAIALLLIFANAYEGRGK